MTETKLSKRILETAKFDLGDIVYLRVAQERKPGMVTAISLREFGVIYTVSWAGNDL